MSSGQANLINRIQALEDLQSSLDKKLKKITKIIKQGMNMEDIDFDSLLEEIETTNT